MGFPPNGELVAVHWIKGIEGIEPSAVATTLPGIDNATFAAHGWIQATAVGGVPDGDTPMQASRIQIDAWAFNKNSGKVPWGKAMTLAMFVKGEVDRGTMEHRRVVSMPDNFDDAYVHSVVVEIDPRRLPDEAYARYSMDLIIYWTRRLT